MSIRFWKNLVSQIYLNADQPSPNRVPTTKNAPVFSGQPCGVFAYNWRISGFSVNYLTKNTTSVHVTRLKMWCFNNMLPRTSKSRIYYPRTSVIMTIQVTLRAIFIILSYMCRRIVICVRILKEQFLLTRLRIFCRNVIKQTVLALIL